WPVFWLQAEVVHSVPVHVGHSGMAEDWMPPERSTLFVQVASAVEYPPISSMRFGVESMLGDIRTLILNSSWQNPGVTGWFWLIRSGTLGVKTTSFGESLTPCPVVQITGQLLMMVPS